MRWPWKRQARKVEPRPVASRAQKLETAKGILAEVFHARAGEVKKMIQRRIDEVSWPEEKEISTEGVLLKRIRIGQNLIM
jgi:hypothetical protein